ncbi:MAG: hypothetical protein ACI8S6_005993, partial [Myxococcota bacterium]
ARELAAKAIAKAAARAAPKSRLAGLEPRAKRPMTALEAARAAAAREEADRAAAPATVSAEEQVRIARALAAKAMAKAAPLEAAVSAEEQVRIARALAAKALLQAEPAADLEPEPERVPKTLSDRAQRPVTALEAARAAVVVEEQQSERRRRRRVSKLTARVRRLVPERLPGLGPHTVANAILTDERELLSSLWRGHRAKFLSEGHIERAVGASTVLHALDTCPKGALIAAHVVTDASDYLVWLDMEEGTLLAAFSDARAWFAS